MEEERNYTVYMHVNKETGKTYIGITHQEVERRWRNGNGYMHNEYFTRAINKYGWDNFEHIILFENKTKEEAEELEILYIKILLSNNKIYGYNISNGGETIGKHSEESKKKMSKNRKGILHTEEAKKKISIATSRGNNAGAKKVYCDGKIFDCIVDCAEYYGINYSQMFLWLSGENGMPQEFFDKNLHCVGEQDKTRLHIDLIRGNSPFAKKVICDGVIYDCLTDCADKYNINICTMSNWLIGDNRMPQKFIDMNLRYLDDNTIVYQAQDKNNKGKQVICDNKVFKSVKLCSEYYNIKRETMNSWLLGKRKMPKRFIDLELKYYSEEEVIKYEKIKKGKEIVCDNMIFNSISECSRYYNVDRRKMNYWLLKPQYMPQEFKSKELNYYINK